ncbi:MAG TPA: DUF2147 domain-containing protein [Aestuariivirga sp.]|nr:DUF2147 domain-containing protein [Aestuariivirga sp.]
MTYTKIVMWGIAALAFTAGTALADGPQGTWKRQNGDTVKALVSNGKLYCKIVSGSKPGFEMCHGMAGSGNTWAGGAMKHPSMPGFMTFNGSVSVSGNSLSIKGCAVGKSMCDSERWSRVK